MPDDDYQAELLFYKSIQSYIGLIPSSDFNENEYNLYLHYASAEELEKDILTEKTYSKIFPEQYTKYTNFSQARLMRYL